ncbi:hypothetical protein RND71_015559 [Anisodus tanguticus]|uniref:Uncharacterized protein n=1 Tax=Anisodus tanguticus TaxID=243964 RepID=A0AAE1S6E9_9SOLA|nr:hypothetical protein RND71_015559 [Anisodus tanguticus]
MPSFMDLQESNEFDFPISLKESTNTHPKSDLLTIPLPLPPSKKFLSNSLPNSTTSSPRFASNSSKKRTKNQNHQPSPLSNNPLARQHSVALTNLERLKENHLRRSKSCGEGRSTAPPEKHVLGFTKVNNNSVKHVEASKVSKVLYKSSGDEDKVESIDQKFKCGAMCLFIPGLGKAKQVRARRVEPEIVPDIGLGHSVSRKVSLEKFECGSWTSSAIINDEENDESNNLFFDLPIELIQYSDDKDTCSPVTTGFVFDKEPKGVLKNSTTAAKTADRKLNESTTRHVRFSTSSPDSGSPTSCMTPRLRRAREDFNALLEAQCV